jgi:hypothetical protein
VLRLIDHTEPPHLMTANAIEFCRVLAKGGYRTVSEPGNLVTPVTGGQLASLINRVAPAQPRKRAAVFRHDRAAWSLGRWA